MLVIEFILFFKSIIATYPNNRIIKKKMTDLNRRILHIALPAIVSNITVPLLGLIDVAIVGHLGSAAYIGAIAVGGMIFNVMYWLFGFLRMGTSGMTSQALGQRNLTEAVRLLVRSVGVAMAVALVMILLQVPLRQMALSVMQPSAAVREFAEVYFDILIWGAPAMLCLYSLTGWFIGMQNSRMPMVIAITQNVVNIVASLGFVFGLGMKVEGVALGTLVAQYAGFLMAVVMWVVAYGRLWKHFQSEALFAWRSMKGFLGVNRDIFLRTLCLISVMLFFTSAGSWQGETVLAVNTLLMQFYMIFSYFMDGFAYAGEAISGKYYGAGNSSGLQQSVRNLFGWGAAMTVIFTLLYIIGGDAFLSLLTDDHTVVAAAHGYSFWASLVPLLGMAAFIWDGVFIGCTKTRGMLLSMFFSSATFFTVYYSLRSSLANHALWIAFLAYMAMRGIAQTLLWRREMKRVE